MMDAAHVRNILEKESAAPDVQEYRGLCSSCMHTPGCTFPRNAARPVIQCEEFEAMPPREVKMAGKNILHAVESVSNPSADEDEPGKYTGLCKNCSNRKDCTYPKPEGGVWRCEEYI